MSSAAGGVPRPPRDVAAPDGAADARWMDEAIREAAAARDRGEVPVGALVLREGCVLGRAGNVTIAERDPAGHAEVRALRAAGAAAGSHRLGGALLYVTIEPCAMCMGAALQARIARLIYGCADPKGGAAGSVVDLAAHPRLNHRIEVTRGVREAECRTLLQDFFRARR